MKLKLDDIIIDPTVYPRSQVSDHLIARMRDALRTGACFPPIIVEAGTHKLVDGRHRYETFKLEKLQSIDADEKVYASEGELFADAVRLNVSHGEPLDTYSVKRAIERLMKLGFERDKIVDVVRMPLEHIDRIVRGFAINPQGEPMALKGGLQHMAGVQLTPQQVETQRTYGGAKGSFYAKTLADMIEADMWPRDSVPFVQQMDRLIQLWVSVRQ